MKNAALLKLIVKIQVIFLTVLLSAMPVSAASEDEIKQDLSSGESEDREFPADTIRLQITDLIWMNTEMIKAA